MELKWIKLCTNIFDDEKIALIESMPDADSIIVIWFKILCLAGKQNNCGVLMLSDRIPYTEEMLATIFRRPMSTVRLALTTFESFGMIEVVNGTITIPNWDKHQSLDVAERQKELSRVRSANYRRRQKAIAEENVSVTQGNVTRHASVTQNHATEEDIEEDIDKNIKEIDKEKPTRHKYGEYQNVLLIDLHNRNLAQKKRALQSVNDMSLTCQRSQGIEEDIEEDVDKNIKEINKESFCVFH